MSGLGRNNCIEHTVTEPNAEGMRADLYVSHVLGICSRSQLPYYNLTVKINGSPAKLSKKVKEGDRLTVSYAEPEPPEISPEDIPLDILYEDDNVIVVNKPRGMVVHPAKGNYSGTLVQGLMHYCKDLAKNFDSETVRPGIVHRLDKDTTGVVITAKNSAAHEALARQFRNRKTKKRYLAVVKGRPPEQDGRIEKNIERDRTHRKRFMVTRHGGKRGVTRYRIRRIYDGYSLLMLSPFTGRTHQLRVHMSWIGCPILGDPVYARRDKRFPDAPLMLHARSLAVTLPGETEPRRFSAPVPEDFKEVLARIEYSR